MSDDCNFHKGELAAQQRWRTSEIWDAARRKRLLWDSIPEQLMARVAAAPFFFLATSNSAGECDCSFKGGGPGLIHMLDSKRFAFPDFDGNGAFMSLGNILENPQVGCLFMDFNDGARLRVNGRATIHTEGAMRELFPAAPRVVLVEVALVVPNCKAYVPRLVPKDSVDATISSFEN
jgi:predicted pyridoxine 5'-phosphate oxidase superfamily flavin-nucleotide-binding protein